MFPVVTHNPQHFDTVTRLASCVCCLRRVTQLVRCVYCLQRAYTVHSMTQETAKATCPLCARSVARLNRHLFKSKKHASLTAEEVAQVATYLGKLQCHVQDCQFRCNQYKALHEHLHAEHEYGHQHTLAHACAVVSIDGSNACYGIPSVD